MMKSEWETSVIEAVAEALDVGYSDAAGVVEAQPFYMQQSWGMDLDVKQTAEKILAAARQ